MKFVEELTQDELNLVMAYRKAETHNRIMACMAINAPFGDEELELYTDTELRYIDDEMNRDKNKYKDMCRKLSISENVNVYLAIEKKRGILKQRKAREINRAEREKRIALKGS